MFYMMRNNPLYHLNEMLSVLSDISNSIDADVDNDSENEYIIKYNVVKPNKQHIRNNKQITPIQIPDIQKVRFNNPATIVWFSDGSKTTAVASHGDKYDKEVGLGICILKRVLGNKEYRKIIDEWVNEAKRLN